MNHEEAKLKVQALIDNELNEEEIREVLDHLQSCYRCRNEYINMKTLERKMKGIRYPEPSKEWFDGLHANPARNRTLLFGKIVLGMSYALVFCWLIYRLISDGSIDIPAKFGLGGMIIGGIVLFMVTLGDRIRENRDDKYKGVMK